VQDQTPLSSPSNRTLPGNPPEVPDSLESLKLTAMKELAYGASHEINNPLANIAARAQTLLRDETAPERRHALEAIHRQAMRAHEMISDLMLFARPPALVTELIDLRLVVEDVLAELAESFHQRAVQLLWKRPELAFDCLGDPGQLAVAIMAVCTNSLEAIGTGGEVVVSLRRSADHSSADDQAADCQISIPDEPLSPVEWLVLEIADDGPGISEQVRPHIFDPFFSGREAGRGLGFGLSKCWRIITQHGGTVDASNRPEQCPSASGACVVIRLPASHDADSEEPTMT
jgi:signal transduction histidine kinase